MVFNPERYSLRTGRSRLPLSEERDHGLYVDRADAECRKPQLRLILLSTAKNRRPHLSFFVMVVAAAEAAVGLAIILTVFKNRGTLQIDEVDTMKL